MSSMKLFLLNEKSDRYVMKDGEVGRKIIREKHKTNEPIVYFLDNKGEKKYTGSPIPAPRTRCPKGFRRDPKTKECVQVKPKSKNKRCPNGTRRDPKTKQCIPKMQALKKKKPITKKNMPITPRGQEVPQPISKQGAQTFEANVSPNYIQERNVLEKIYEKNKISLKDLETTWSIVEIPPDHFCGYHALSLFLKMRNSGFVSQNEDTNVTKLIQELKTLYEKTKPTDNLTAADIKTRLRELSDGNIQSKWMSDEDMVVFSKKFDICFAVFRRDPTLNILHWQVIRHDVPSTEANFETVFQQCARKKNIIFLYNPDFPGLHYDLLLPRKDETFPTFSHYEIVQTSIPNPLFGNSYIMQRLPDENSPESDTRQYIVQLTPEFQSTDYSSAQSTPQKAKKPLSPPPKSSAPPKPSAPPITVRPRKPTKDTSPFVFHNNNQLVKMIETCFKKA